MKILRFLVIAVAALLISACNGYDDSDLIERIENLEKEVASLQSQVGGINSEINALKITLNAINSRDVVTYIKAIEENGVQGFEITYEKSGTVRIFLNSSSDTPMMGVREVGGVLYWTWNGSLLLDNNGKMIPCTGANGTNGTNGKDGITPKVEIQNGYWCVSYDNGQTWTRLEKAQTGSGSSMFRSVEVIGGNLVIVLNDGTKLTIPVSSIEKPTSFDENNIVLSLGAISDTHIGNGYGSEEKLTKALTQLKNRAAEKDADGLDAVMVVGDLVNTATNSQISTFKTRYEGVLDPVKVPMIYTIGNHDMNPNYRWTAQTVDQNKTFHEILGDNYFLTDLDQDMRKQFECRHCVIGDYHILCVTPNGTSPIVYDANTMTWLNKELKEITDENPNKFVIVLTHPMIYNTVYGSLLQDTYTALGDYWATKALSSILAGYPQVVTFGGHLHFPLNDPRSIWQGEFTALGCASTSYMAIENGGYEGMSGVTVMADAGEYSQGLLVQFDANGFMRLTRMDFYHETVIGQVWEVNSPSSDKSHLDKYNHTALKSANTAPVLSEINASIGALSDGKAPVSVTWAAGTDDEFVHHYVLELKKGSTIVATRKVLADFYRSPQPSMMKSEYTLSLGNLETGSYTLSLVAWDSWDASSAPLEKNFTVSDKSSSLWTGDDAGSKDVEGGSGSVSGSWLSYSAGKVSWTSNTTGKPRSETISLPNGENFAVTQVEAKDFAGSWTLAAKTFAPNTNLGVSANNSYKASLTIAAKSGQTAKDGSKDITNNLTVSGLINSYVAEAVAEIDYADKTFRFGIFFDGAKAQAVETGKSGYGYITLLPELGNGWSSYNFCPVPFNNGANKGWIWFVTDSFNAMHYGMKDWQKFDGKDILGLAFCACKSATPSAGDYASVNASSGTSGYDVIYQCNTNGANDPGFILSR